MKLILLFLLASMLQVPVLPAPEAQPLPPIAVTPKDRLLAEICAHETQAHRSPEFAVNPGGSAWGVCQIKYFSAVAYGGFDNVMHRTGHPSRNPGDLFRHDVNMATAHRILNGCRRLHGTRKIRLLVYCYGAGPNSPPYRNREHRRWSKQIASDYAESQRWLDFKGAIQ